MTFNPSTDAFDLDPQNVDAYGLEEKDRKALADLLLNKGPRAVKEALEKRFGISSFENEVEDKKRHEAKVEKMAEALNRFQLHFPLWLNTERNQATILRFIKENGLTEFNYKVLVEMWNQYAHLDGVLDLDESAASSNPYYVGQINPASGYDADFMPRKRVDQMSAEEFSAAIARSRKFRARIDGDGE